MNRLVHTNFSPPPSGGQGQRHQIQPAYANLSLHTRLQQAADWKWISGVTALCLLSELHLNIESLWWVLKRSYNHVESPRIVGLEETSDINSTLQQDTLQWLPIALGMRSKCCPQHTQPPSGLHFPSCSVIQSNLFVAAELAQMQSVCLKCFSISSHPQLFLTNSSLSFSLNLKQLSSRSLPDSSNLVLSFHSTVYFPLFKMQHLISIFLMLV